MSTTEVLRCLILSPTPPSFRSARRPCCSCRGCWPPNAAVAVLAHAGALLAARAAGHTHVHVDGTLVRTDRCHVPGPTARTDGSDRRGGLWWAGKHARPRGNVQGVTVPPRRPVLASPGRPGRAHDTPPPPAPAPA